MKGSVDLTKANIQVRCIQTFHDLDDIDAFIEGKVYPCVNNLGDGYWYAQREDQNGSNVVFINGDKPDHKMWFKSYFVVEEDHTTAYDRAMAIV